MRLLPGRIYPHGMLIMAVASFISGNPGPIFTPTPGWTPVVSYVPSGTDAGSHHQIEIAYRPVSGQDFPPEHNEGGGGFAQAHSWASGIFVLAAALTRTPTPTPIDTATPTPTPSP